MNLQGRNLSIEMQGDDVKLLHSELQQLGYDIPANELEGLIHTRFRPALFGRGTRAAVLAFQEANRLEPTGEVDERTASAINAAVDALQARSVSGQIRLGDDPYAGVLVRAFHVDDRGGTPFLGAATTDPAGHFVIRYELPPEVERINLRVVVSAETGNLLLSSDIIRAAQQQAVVDLTIPLVEQPAARVYGMVRDAYGDPLDGATVQAYDYDMRGRQLLGSVLTQAGGFEIRYHQSQFLKAERERADLVLKVLDANGAELHRTQIQYNVPDELEVNINLGGAAYKGPSVFQVVTDTLTPLLDGLSPLELREDTTVLESREDSTFQDISFLAGESGYSKLVIGTWAICHRLADKTAREETPLEATVFFGFMRQGQPVSLPDSLVPDAQYPERITLIEEKILRELASISPELQQSLLEKACADNLIPARIKSRLKEILETLRQIKLRFGADMTYGAGKGTISQLLDLNPAAKPAQTAFMAALLDHTGPLNTFWETLEKNNILAPELVQDVKLTFELGALTRNHIPLVGELKHMFQTGEVQAKRTLATYSTEDWKRVFLRPGSDGQPIGVPANIDGNDDDAKMEQFAVILDQHFERAYPTTSFAAKLNRAEESPVTAKADVVRFIEQNPDFHLDRHRVDHYLAEHTDALQGIEDKAALLNSLASLERIFKLSPTHKVVHVLLARKIDSAQQIYFIGPEQFLTAMVGSGINTIEAKRLSQKAEDTYALTLALFGEYNIALSGVQPFGVATHTPDEATRAKIAALPNLRTLFGSLDYCECIHCRSVYGPAAYFVDVMHFLGARETQGTAINKGKNIQHVLLERRPDLGEIELSCENTNTPLPYIDLVNEIMEDVVSPPPPVALDSTIEGDLVAGPIRLRRSVLIELKQKVGISDDAEVYAPDSRGRWAVRDRQHAYKIFKTGTTLNLLPTRQSFLSAAELRANPEYTNQSAYDKLKDEVFPISLPFDLWHVQARTYLNHLGVPQPRLLELFQHTSSVNVTLAPTAVQIDCAWLDITETERKIITDALPGTSPWDFWGLKKDNNTILDPEDPAKTIVGSWIEVLSHVNVMLHRSGLDYKELLQLLDMQYVNPAGSIFIFDTADPNAANCDTSLFTIRNLEMNNTALSRMHQFIRLWRKLGCAMWELDLLLSDTAPNKRISDTKLQEISGMNRVRTQTGLDWRIIYSLYNTIDHKISFDRAQSGAPAVQTLYERLFRNKLVDASASFPSRPDQIIGSIAAKVPSIRAALRISETDLNLILVDLNRPLTSTLDITVLSHIHRITVLAHALSLKVDQFLRLQALWAQDPFANPGATLTFIELAQQVADSNFSIPELDYLLANHFVSSSSVALEDKTIITILQSVRVGLQKISDDLRLKTEETQEAYVKSRLGLLPALVKDADQAIALSIIDGTSIKRDAPKAAYIKSKLSIVPALANNAAKQAIAFAIIEDTWQGTPAQRDGLIDTFFAGVLDLTEAKTKLAAISGALTPENRQAEVDRRFVYMQFALEIFAFFAGVLDLTEAKTNLAAIRSGLAPDAHQAAVDTRFEYVQRALESFLLQTQKEAFISQKVAEVLQLDGPSAQALLTGLHVPPGVTTTLLQSINDTRLLDRATDGTYQLALDMASFPAIFTSLRLLHKVALMISKLQMNALELTWWLDGGHATGMGWMHPQDFLTDPIAQIDIQRWIAIQQFFAWKDGLPTSNLTAFEFASNVLDDAKPFQANVTDLAQLAAWDKDDINDLLTAFNWLDTAATPNATKQALSKSANLIRLDKCMRALRRLGVHAERALQWATAEPDNAVADSLKQTVKAKYDLSQWLHVIQPIQDEFREQKRQALVSWLVAHPETKGQQWFDANGLYGYFLIDVEMSACMLTSRLKQAAASAQLFVQRCLLNLEMDILAKTDLDPKWKQWKWMKNYRVWEANRKVFLYPENWIEPELRDEKSPFFKDLENELMQNDVTNDIAEQAYVNYLEKLDKVANLEIRAMYNQVPDQRIAADQSVLHVFGRTRGNLAPEYYYRKRISGGRWLAWQKVDLEINANLLAPSVFNNRLYLFWPQFIEKANMPTTLSTPQLGQSNAPIQAPDKYWEIRLFWSELKKGKWTPKALSDKFVTLQQNEATYEDLALRLTTAPTEGNMVVQLFDSGKAADLAPGNHFDFHVIGKQIDVLHRKWSAPQTSEIDKANPSLTTLKTESSLETWYLLVAIDSQVRDGLIRNNTAIVNYTYALQPSTSTRIVVTTTTKEIPPPVKNYLSLPQPTFIVDASFAGKEARNHYPTNLLIEKDTEITVSAVTPTGLKFGEYQNDAYGPGGVSSPGGVSAPMKDENAFALLAKIGEYYYHIGEGSTFTAHHEGLLSFLFNDNDATHNAGYAFVNIVAVKRPEPKVIPPFKPVVTAKTSVPDPQTATDARNSQRLISNGVPGSFIVVDSYNRNIDSGAGGQFFYWDKSRTYFVEYKGSPQAGFAYEPYEPESHISSFKFFIHYHPFVELFTKQLNIHGLKGLLNRNIQVEPMHVVGSPALFDFNTYAPNTSTVVGPGAEEVDFSYKGAYSAYNWELFFHVPIFIANKLSANQRYQEALEWFHYIFDPTSTDNTLANPDTPQQKFWITKPFYATTKADYYQQKIENIMLAIAKKDPNDADGMRAQVAEWRENPFNPHLIARMRNVAYQKNVLIKYIGNLIGWGDQLFRQDTIETLNEATQLYILAASILGSRPKSIPKSIPNPVKTFYQLQNDIDDFGNALKQVENLLPASSSVGTGDARNDDRPELPRLDVLYFCIPHNEKLLTLWDTVADRLFKIRHCMNIEGVVRQLPLFEPPIDPALLVKAAAAGLDIGAVLNDMNAPLPLYRFTFMLQRAMEICSEVKSLGGAMLAALEKRDAEAFTLLRASHERMMLGQVRLIKNSQVDESLRAKEAMDESKRIIEEKKNYHQKLISDGWSAGESTAFGLATAATVLDAAIAVGYTLAGGLKLVPSFLAGGAGVGGTPTVHATFGGKEIGGSAEMAASTLRSIAAALDKGASLASTAASYARRSAEWEHQKLVAEKELVQMEKQIAAANIRHQIATQDLANHDKQIENAQKEDEYMRAKFTNRELYDWMISQISTVYFQSYQLAYDVAKRAERCFRYELGLSDSSYIQFGYWDSLKKGLLSGEKLSYDLKRLETAYYEQNRREYELTKHISLAQLDPIALLKLRQNGECFVDIPETTFDMDYPGHYFRRIKTVGLSIPCIAGPYTTVACTLTLVSNHLRKDSNLLDNRVDTGYDRDLTTDDLRFRDEIAAIQSIATSNAQNDKGMFELNFRDERYLPFEGAGAISSWHIKLNKDLPQFDFSTISDVVMHMHYTAREGGELLRSGAVENFTTKMNALALAENRLGLFRVFDLKREYPDAWYRFLHPATGDQELELGDLPDRLPYFTRGFTTKNVRRIEVVALMKKPAKATDPAPIYRVMLSPVGIAEGAWLLLELPTSPTYHGMHMAAKELPANSEIPFGSMLPFAAWTLKIKRDGETGFKSLPADEIQELFLIINYTIA